MKDWGATATHISTNYVSPLFVRLHYRRAKIPFTPQPKMPPFFGTMFAVQHVALASSHKNSEKNLRYIKKNRMIFKIVSYLYGNKTIKFLQEIA